jgi:hypothetical protein
MHSETVFRPFGRSHEHGRMHFVERRAWRWSRSVCSLALCRTCHTINVLEQSGRLSSAANTLEGAPATLLLSFNYTPSPVALGTQSHNFSARKPENWEKTVGLAGPRAEILAEHVAGALCILPQYSILRRQVFHWNVYVAMFSESGFSFNNLCVKSMSRGSGIATGYGLDDR